MTYKLKESNNGVVASHSLAEIESFWLYHDFSVNTGSGNVTVGNGYVAVHFSQNPDKNPRINKPKFIAGGATQTYVIEDAGGNKITLNLSLIASRRIETSNEFSQIHLFKFSGNAGAWISEAGWKTTRATPVVNRDQTTFIDHVVSVGDEARYAFAVMDREDTGGVSNLAFVRAYLPGSLFATILALQGTRMKPLKLSSRGEQRVWNYFQTTPLPGLVTGYVSVVDGVFKNITVGEIERWLLSAIPAPDVMDRLAELVYRPPQRGTLAGYQNPGVVRTLDTIDMTNSNGVTPPTASLPIEVAYLCGLSANTPVPAVI